MASFNVGEPTKIDCVIPLVTEISHGNPLQRHVTIEEYLQGNYQKFNSNGGFEDRQLSNILLAFSHWTWEKSCRQIMICDLQGRYFKFLIYLAGSETENACGTKFIEKKFFSLETKDINLTFCQNWGWVLF